MGYKKFSIEGANSILPKIEKKVKRIVGYRKKIRDLQGFYISEEHSNVGDFDLELLKLELEELYGRLNEEMNFLDSVGVIVKDFDKGLVDFVSEFEGRDVFLCWMLGEDKVKYWHEMDDGFLGRKPIIYIT